MRPSLRLGLEFPPIALPRGGATHHGALDGHRAVARAAEASGFTTLWFAEPPADDESPCADGCTVAASLASSLASAHLGVVAARADGRRPSVLARDVTALDHVTVGRSALLLRSTADDLAQPDVARSALVEATTICRALLTVGAGGEVSFMGDRFSVEKAPNRPAPLQAGGPPVVAGLAGLFAGSAGGERWAELLAALVPHVDAISTDGTAGGLRRWRAVLDATPAPADGRPALLWTGVLPADRAGATRWLADLEQSGVDGLICLLPADTGTPTGASPAAWEELLDAWGPALAAWSGRSEPTGTRTGRDEPDEMSPTT